MSHTPHELAAEFPEFAQRISALKSEDAHFARLADEYHEVNRTIHRAETNVEAMAPDHESVLRRRRVALKDEIYGILSAQTA